MISITKTSNASKLSSIGWKPNIRARPFHREAAITSGQSHYYSAWGVVRRSFPLLKCIQRNVGEEDPAEVLELMNRVEIIPSHRRTLFGPKITIHLKDGRSFTKSATGTEFIWDFPTLTTRLKRDCSRTSHFRGAIRRACCSVSWIG